MYWIEYIEKQLYHDSIEKYRKQFSKVKNKEYYHYLPENLDLIYNNEEYSLKNFTDVEQIIYQNIFEYPSYDKAFKPIVAIIDRKF